METPYLDSLTCVDETLTPTFDLSISADAGDVDFFTLKSESPKSPPNFTTLLFLLCGVANLVGSVS